MLKIKNELIDKSAKTVVCLAGEPNPPFMDLNDTAVVICADGGAALARKCGLRPDLIIGDGDSISEEDLKWCSDNCIALRFVSKEKDFTDGELALAEAREFGGMLYILGGMGGRFDHMLANIFVAAKELRHFTAICFDNGENTLYLLPAGNYQLYGQAGLTVSLLAIMEDAEGVCFQGMRYPLNNEVLPLGAGRGISNFFCGQEAELSFTKGRIMVWG
ncbi:MAG: thiamine diphosphokinase [Clostridia bacterium]|nr:thiamine diphosphokinase [Clostridia bacterium]MDD4798170.1 thiamine diphosphokinase [Clostridia bacterium]